MIRVAKAMAMTAYDLLADPELMASAKKEFEARQRAQSAVLFSNPG